jgi:hypothetical protein
MVDQTNSIKEILKNTKDLLSQDQELAKEENDFNDKVAKALEGNILVLNKIYENKSVDEIDKRSKKVIEIVEHQIQDVLTLDKEVSSVQQTLLLHREVEDQDQQTLLLNREVKDENQNLAEDSLEEKKENLVQVATNVNTLEEQDLENSDGLLVSRVKQLEQQQERMLSELNKLVDELKSLNPSEEISLKFDILTNQFSNELDEKIESVKADIVAIDQSKDHLAAELGDQKNTMDLGFSNLEKSNEEFKDQLNNLDFKIDDFTNSLENKISEQMHAQDQKIESQEASLQKQMNDNFNSLKTLMEEDKTLRKKEEEENKKNSPEHQANLRLNSIYKLLEMQATQSLINSNINPQNTTLTNSVSDNISHESRPSMNSNPARSDNTHLKAIADLSQKLEPLIHLNETLAELSKSIQDRKDTNYADERNVLDTTKLNEILQKINNFSNQESKLEELAQSLSNMKESKDSNNSNHLENEKLIKYFKSYEFKSLEKLNVDLKEVKQFDDLNLAKNFVEKLILSETQGWISNNQIEIEEISKKLLYK